jgi:hypothetical protein
MACPEAIPKVWNLAADIPLALDNLLDAAGLEPATYRSADALAAVRAAGIDVPDVAPRPVTPDHPTAKATAVKKTGSAKRAAAKKTAAKRETDLQSQVGLE